MIILYVLKRLQIGIHKFEYYLIVCNNKSQKKLNKDKGYAGIKSSTLKITS